MNDTANSLILDFIRHGEPEGGVMYRGSKDDPLSELGWTQMRRAITRATEDGQSWDAIFSSPLKRCHAFAQEVGTARSLTCTVIDNLREMHFGDLEGLRPEQASQAHADLLKALWKSPETITPPNAESFPAFVGRVEGAIDEICMTPRSRALIVAHGGVIRAALKILMNMSGTDSFRVDVPYASITRFTVHRRPDKKPIVGLAFINGYRGA